MYKLLLLTLLVSACSNHKTTHRLELIQVYEVATQGLLEPSGLTLWNNKFYTVSDKHDYIYQLEFKYAKVSLKPIIKIINDKGVKLDFEGITHDENFFYLISEKHFRILKVSFDGTQQTWLPRNNQLKLAGTEVGLFQTHGAYFEGICLLDNDKFLLAAERQPRGFVEYDYSNNIIKAYQVNSPVFQYKDNRSPDFTGLSCDDGIYVLDRNAYMVAKLNNIKGKLQEGIGYSYEHIINYPQHQYLDMQFGQAEGLVVKGDKIYIILDNNRNYHITNPKNNNSLLLELRRY